MNLMLPLITLMYYLLLNNKLYEIINIYSLKFYGYFFILLAFQPIWTEPASRTWVIYGILKLKDSYVRKIVFVTKPIIHKID